jgi:hypothetical protein
MLGGRSRQDLWINRAQAYAEVYQFATRPECEPWVTDGRGRSEDRGYSVLRDVLRASRQALGDAWGDNKRFMITRDVTLKALLRLSADVVDRAGQLGISPGMKLDGPLAGGLRTMVRPDAGVPPRGVLRGLSGGGASPAG